MTYPNDEFERSLTATVPVFQFMRPSGLRRAMQAPVRPEVKAMWHEIADDGYVLTAELVPGGTVHMTISSDEEDVAGRLVPNGPQVPRAMDAMITEYHDEHYGGHKDATV